MTQQASQSRPRKRTAGRYFLMGPRGAKDPAYRFPYTVLWDWITFYGWGWDMRLPFCWLTYSQSSGLYLSRDATPQGAFVFLWRPK